MMGHMGDGVQGQKGTSWMYSVNLVNVFIEYVNIYLCNARGQFVTLGYTLRISLEITLGFKLPVGDVNGPS